MTPGRTTGPGFIPDGSRESGMVSAGMVGFPIAVTFCPSANIGDDTLTAGGGGEETGVFADGGADGGAGSEAVGAETAGGGAVSGVEGTAGAGAAGAGGTGLGRMATGGGSGGELSPI